MVGINVLSVQRTLELLNSDSDTHHTHTQYLEKVHANQLLLAEAKTLWIESWSVKVLYDGHSTSGRCKEPVYSSQYQYKTSGTLKEHTTRRSLGNMLRTKYIMSSTSNKLHSALHFTEINIQKLKILEAIYITYILWTYCWCCGCAVIARAGTRGWRDGEMVASHPPQRRPLPTVCRRPVTRHIQPSMLLSYEHVKTS